MPFLRAMVSRSKGRKGAAKGSQLVTSLRGEKATTPPLADKLRGLLQLQRARFPQLSQERALKSWERPWDVEP